MSPTGRGIPRAVVHLTDQNGGIRTAMSNPFGYYRFEDVEVRQTLLFNVFHKRFQFQPRVVNIDEKISSLNFVADN